MRMLVSLGYPIYTLIFLEGRKSSLVLVSIDFALLLAGTESLEAANIL